MIDVSHLEQEISVSKSVSQKQKLVLPFLLLFVANEIRPMKVNVQNVGMSFVQNERNTLYQRDIIHSLIYDKDRVSFFPGRCFSGKISCLCFHPNSHQALQLEQLEQRFSFFSTIVP